MTRFHHSLRCTALMALLEWPPSRPLRLKHPPSPATAGKRRGSRSRSRSRRRPLRTRQSRRSKRRLAKRLSPLPRVVDPQRLLRHRRKHRLQRTKTQTQRRSRALPRATPSATSPPPAIAPSATKSPASSASQKSRSPPSPSSSNPTNAEVFVNDTPRTDASDPVFLDPGQHTIEARAPGYDSEKQTLVATAGAERNLNLVLKQSLAPAALTTAPPTPEPAASAVPAPAPIAPPSPDSATSSGRSIVPALVAGGIAAVGSCRGDWIYVECKLERVGGGGDSGTPAILSSLCTGHIATGGLRSPSRPRRLRGPDEHVRHCRLRRRRSRRRSRSGIPIVARGSAGGCRSRSYPLLQSGADTRPTRRRVVSSAHASDGVSDATTINSLVSRHLLGSTLVACGGDDFGDCRDTLTCSPTDASAGTRATGGVSGSNGTGGMGGTSGGGHRARRELQGERVEPALTPAAT